MNINKIILHPNYIYNKDLFIKYKKKNVHTHTHILAGTQKDHSVAALAPQSHTDLYTYKHPCITYLQYLQYLQS